MTFYEILNKYRNVSFSERNKGDRFERLMQSFLLTAPQYQAVLKDVWLWNEFPFRKDFGSGKDVGIDLVARTFDGKYWAIQCKCYDSNTQITKADVDTFLSTSEKRFRNDELQAMSFSHRLWISTTNKWSSEARLALQNLAISVSTLSLFDLESAPVDWGKLEEQVHGPCAILKEREIRKHQQKAITLFHEHFKTADRGRLIMACGTGKTFTSLRIAENETNGEGLILFLVPSIALLGQTLNEWTTFAQNPIKPICICSDAEVSRKKTDNDEGGFTVEDLALPASTNVDNIVHQFEAAQKNPNKGMTVVFSTYQSIERVSEAQKTLNALRPNSCVFNLVICDEAHRTTGVALKKEDGKRGGYDETAFIRVHNNDFIMANKRIYMTATPRLYKDDVKEKAKEADAYLCSMDDAALYGEEVYRIGFGEAVEKDLLSDYKVLVLTAQESEIPKEFQEAIANSEGEINADDIAKLIGCINALSKRMVLEEDLIKSSDPSFMHTAVAFCQNIKISKHITAIFNEQKNTYYETLPSEIRNVLVSVSAQHIDGSMGASTRQEKLSWLKSVSMAGNDCRILTNVRCLSEGVDVPSLDAVMFLSSRNSQVDVVQSVGRVMRKAPGKKYGYIIIPVIIPESMSPEDALDKSDCFGVVWTVLNALRAHDDRFNAEINKIELNKRMAASISRTIGGSTGEGYNGHGREQHIYVDGVVPPNVQLELNLKYESLQGLIFARMVKKVGTRRYWELWAKDVASVAEQHIKRIHALISEEGPHKKAFDQFLSGLHKNLNPAVSASEAVEMLAQHIITKPVFEALFENYSFVKNNPVSVAMQRMIDALHEEIPEREADVMAKFYKSIAERVEGIDNAEGKQKIIIELYDKFFKSAFPKVVDKLGIVYTPVEVVDFIVHSVSDVLQKEFGRKLTDENVHILDPFTGTGTFITRLLQSGLIAPEDLERKYAHELHANELVLLAYYIASINIENVYHDLTTDRSTYHSFNGICLTDTFQLGESDDSDRLFSEMFSQNSERVIAQKKAPIRVIIGNPPYSVGQKSANDNAQNQSYPHLEDRIAETYARQGKATSKKALYDSYIKAFRWATDRLDKNGGVIAFVSNAGWLDGNGMDGLRKCLEEEFSTIYVFNLRGNCRTSGELRRKEGGNVFGLGSRTPISITLLVKNPANTQKKAQIYCRDIGDYLSQPDKLTQVKEFGSILNSALALSSITPNEAGDWINQRNDLFETFIPIAPEKKFQQDSRSYFTTCSLGCATACDTWLYNFSSIAVSNNTKRMLDYYNDLVNTHRDLVYNPQYISWNDKLKASFLKREYQSFNASYMTESLYRPFCKQNLYYDKACIQRTYQIPKIFPTPQTKNLVICVSGIGVTKEFSAIITDTVPDLELIGKSQCFPLYYYQLVEHDQLNLFDRTSEDYIRRDGVSDFILERAKMLNPKITKEDIFYYVYGLLHSPEYRKRFSADLKKSLPHIPFPETYQLFKAFSKAGRELAQLHLNYETGEICGEVIVTGTESSNFHVSKMRFVAKDDKRTIVFNESIRIENIPLLSYDYVLNGKSAIEWVMERYAITINPESKIANDPNQWSENPRYILELLLRIIQMSLNTMTIVTKLPPLNLLP